MHRETTIGWYNEHASNADTQLKVFWMLRTPVTHWNKVHIEDCEGWWLSGCRSSVAEHWLHKPGVLGSIPSDCRPFHFPLFSPQNKDILIYHWKKYSVKITSEWLYSSFRVGEYYTWREFTIHHPPHNSFRQANKQRVLFCGSSLFQ